MAIAYCRNFTGMIIIAVNLLLLVPDTSFMKKNFPGFWICLLPVIGATSYIVMGIFMMLIMIQWKHNT